MQVWDTQVGFHERDLIHFLRERSVLDVKPNSYVVFGSGTTFRNKHLL